jgi:hypothetical protein
MKGDNTLLGLKKKEVEESVILVIPRREMVVADIILQGFPAIGYCYTKKACGSS